MNALLKKAQEVGISEKDAKSTLGGILSFIKTKVSEEQFQTICSKIDGASELVQETEATRAQGGDGTSEGGGEGGGFMGMASSLMTKLQQDGGSVDSIPELMTFLSGAGVDQKEIAKYLPEVAKILKQKTGMDISSVIGVPSASADDGAADA